MLEKFAELGIEEDILKALSEKGFEEPSPIQAEAIPFLIKEDRDLIARAQTGTGKTAAFGIPIIQKIKIDLYYPQAIILTPTRELALQVSEELFSLKAGRKLFILPVYGGTSIENQISKLKKGVHLIVGTPGRVLDLLNRRCMDISKIKYFVLDEADEMLDMGFIPDVEEILSKTSVEKQVLLFSATVPQRILDLSKKYMSNQYKIDIAPKQVTTSLTEQLYIEVREGDKIEALSRILDIEEDFYGMIFCRTKIIADTLTHKLIERGYAADQIHGDISQLQRERVLKQFKSRKINILVATDVAARGIDVSDLTHVINYNLPQDPESYVHRIGRTGRAGKEGTAITFVTHEEYRKLIFIKKIAKTDIKKEKIPAVHEIIDKKKERIRVELQHIIDDNQINKYSDFADELLINNDAKQIISAVLQYAFEDELDESAYTHIREFNTSVDHKGKSRLFIAYGRKDNMNPKKLVDLIIAKSAVKNERIKDVKILEEFSFITVPFEDAEIILDAFKKEKGRGQKPIVSRAKEKSNDDKTHGDKKFKKRQ